MKTEYAHALLQTIREGMPTDMALAGLRRVLEKNKHTKLLLAILHETLRVLEAEKGTAYVTVTVARNGDYHAFATDINKALSELQVPPNTPVTTVVDATLVGGFVTTFNYKERDQSYKKVLTSLYESITK